MGGIVWFRDEMQANQGRNAWKFKIEQAKLGVTSEIFGRKS